MAVKVSKTVADGLEDVRSSGEINMFDRPGVIMLLCQKGHAEAAAWVEDHKKEYGRLIFEGPEIEQEKGVEG